LKFVQSMMENQLVNDFGVDLLVAKYALISTEFSGVDAAIDFIFGSFEGDVLKHQFFGYTPSEYQRPEDADPETSEVFKRCFVCEKFESSHKVDSARQVLDTQEEYLLERFGSQIDDGSSRRKSSHAEM